MRPKYSKHFYLVIRYLIRLVTAVNTDKYIVKLQPKCTPVNTVGVDLSGK